MSHPVLVKDAATAENRALRGLVTVYRRLSGLLLRREVDLTAITDVLAAELGCWAWVATVELDVVTVSAPEPTDENGSDVDERCRADPQWGTALAAAERSGLPVRVPASLGGTFVAAPITVANRLWAFVITWQAGWYSASEELPLMITEHAAAMCGAVISRERVAVEASGRVREDLITGLLLGRATDEAEATQWAEHLGYDTTRTHRVLVAIVDESGPDARPDPGDERIAPREAEEAAKRRVLPGTVLDAVEEFLVARVPGVIALTRVPETVAIIPEPSPPGGNDGGSRVTDPISLAESAIDGLGRRFPGAVVTVGIGGRCQYPEELARSYSQGRRTLESASRLSRRGQVLSFDALGIHRLLSQVPSTADVRSFAREVLGPLAEPGDERCGGFVETLACYFQCDSSPQRAARVLHVHPNTVTYRLKRAEELTGLRLDRYRDRLMAQVALEALGLMEMES
ncbi:PucR family transcriptional regulator [Haloechinothrix salitolerans]|uniref:PucR family transcriptional regulator n=1 Tax=Haloechinothrix salitolerans TaxID=926830 RepID=A0ABW2BWH6_9PSEU